MPHPVVASDLIGIATVILAVATVVLAGATGVQSRWAKNAVKQSYTGAMPSGLSCTPIE